MTGGRAPGHGRPPSLDDVAVLAERALQTIPEALRAFTAGVVIRIEEFVDEETEHELGLDSPYDLLGLYRGVSLPDRGVTNLSTDVDMVFLYRRPILDYWCETGEDLFSVVRHVLIHEIAHHFGFSDADIESLERDD